ncbi:hypothetical protein [Erwinia sp. OPT-41]|uniref:Uncharacterized protein n=1 Tax=Erwinia plantamica TaxID=3237104 RepID=A0ABW7CRC2_9GAMM
MRNINALELRCVSGGMNIDGLRESSNVIDLRGVDMGAWIDANGACWLPGTTSDIMFPSGTSSAFMDLMAFLRKDREGGGGPL